MVCTLSLFIGVPCGDIAARQHSTSPSKNGCFHNCITHVLSFELALSFTAAVVNNFYYLQISIFLALLLWCWKGYCCEVEQNSGLLSEASRGKLCWYGSSDVMCMVKMVYYFSCKHYGNHTLWLRVRTVTAAAKTNAQSLEFWRFCGQYFSKNTQKLDITRMLCRISIRGHSLWHAVLIWCSGCI